MLPVGIEAAVNDDVYSSLSSTGEPWYCPRCVAASPGGVKPPSEIASEEAPRTPPPSQSTRTTTEHSHLPRCAHTYLLITRTYHSARARTYNLPQCARSHLQCTYGDNSWFTISYNNTQYNTIYNNNIMQYYCGYCSAMCPIMDWKASRWIPSKFFLHIYSGKYVSNRVECCR